MTASIKFTPEQFLLVKYWAMVKEFRFAVFNFLIPSYVGIVVCSSGNQGRQFHNYVRSHAFVVSNSMRNFDLFRPQKLKMDISPRKKLNLRSIKYNIRPRSTMLESSMDNNADFIFESRVDLQNLLPERQKRLEKAVSGRMQGLRIILDGVGDPRNRAAVFIPPYFWTY
jgi:hypothetical protein